MSFEGTSLCEISWDFQGASPILQVTSVGGPQPDSAPHEAKRQIPLVINALRQGRVNFKISSVGGITFQRAAISKTTLSSQETSLYDWKFFNALVNPDPDNVSRLVDVLHDKQTMNRLTDVITLINPEWGHVASYILTSYWRTRDILGNEGIDEPKHVIPGEKMARVASLALTGGLDEVETLRGVIRRVVSGDGLDVVCVKELLGRYVERYEEYAPEIDRVVKWCEVLLGPMIVPQSYVENTVPPLSEVMMTKRRGRGWGIPSAAEIYDTLGENVSLPLDPSFSNLLGSIAPYMSFKQVEYVLETRGEAKDWQPEDMRRLRYVYCVKEKVLGISESYGGLSFLPQSFLLSVFVGEATRASLRARRLILPQKSNNNNNTNNNINNNKFSRQHPSPQRSTLSNLRRRDRHRVPSPTSSLHHDVIPEDFVMSPAGKVASMQNIAGWYENGHNNTSTLNTHYDNNNGESYSTMGGRGQSQQRRRGIGDRNVATGGGDLECYELGDSLLGPQDVAILLQAGLTSSMKGSTVVQLNQRMLLDLIASQPHSFAIGVLCELGNHGGQGSTRGLASVLMALLELDQTSFTSEHRLDMHALLESFSGIKMPRREHYLAGGRWARQSYYEALTLAAKNILEDAEPYMALKGHIQRVRHHVETDPLPGPKELALLHPTNIKNNNNNTSDNMDDAIGLDYESTTVTTTSSSSNTTTSFAIDDDERCHLLTAITEAKSLIKSADDYARPLFSSTKTLQQQLRDECIKRYRDAFCACSKVLELDKLAFQAEWFKKFYRRNYDALMILSVYDNAVEDVDEVRAWLEALLVGSIAAAKKEGGHSNGKERKVTFGMEDEVETTTKTTTTKTNATTMDSTDKNVLFSFMNVQDFEEQLIIDYIIDVLFFDEGERKDLRTDPLVRLLIPNPPGHYNFSIISAMGVITDGKRGTELDAALERLKSRRGVITVRADTGTARSFEFNASKIEEAIESVVSLGRPFGYVGYSQGCANAMTAESLLLSGSPARQKLLSGLVCRQLLFSAANGSVHGAASDAKAQRLIIMCEEAFKYQQGYFSWAFISNVLEMLNAVMDSAPFHKFCGGAQSLLPDGSRAFWREAQHLSHVPTCVLRGVLEEHTTPESLEMLSHMLTKQSGNQLHDSQVHVYDAVGHPVYTKNRNGRILKNCDMGGAVQRTHHWSPLDKEVEFVRTKKDKKSRVFDCAKDRHVFPWVDVNARFGFIKYQEEKGQPNGNQEVQ